MKYILALVGSICMKYQLKAYWRAKIISRERVMWWKTLGESQKEFYLTKSIDEINYKYEDTLFISYNYDK